MPAARIVSTPGEAYKKIRERLENDLAPVWYTLNHSENYRPYWLLVRELFPVAESIGDLIYRSDSTAENLKNLIDNDLSKIRPIYKDKGAIIALLYRHSLMHQDEPRSLYAGNITVEWELAFIDGCRHLITLNKNHRRHTCRMSFDLRAFYQDLIALLECHERSEPKRGVVERYNSWTFLRVTKVDDKHKIKALYNQN